MRMKRLDVEPHDGILEIKPVFLGVEPVSLPIAVCASGQVNFPSSVARRSMLARSKTR